MADTTGRARPRRPTRDLPSTPVQLGAPSESTLSPLVSPDPAQSPNSSAKDDTAHGNELTPLRAHYLKKAILALQFNQELLYLLSSPLATPLSALSLLGHPFTPLPKGTPIEQDIPFTRFMFRQFVLTFPFLAAAPRDFFPNKLQPFLDSLLSRNFSSDITLFPSEEEDPEQAGRAKVLAKIEKHLALLLGSATKIQEPEEVVRLTQKDLDRLEAVAQKRLKRATRNSDKFDVNIVCVRNVSERGRVRTRHHDEFVIRTRRTGHDDVFVSRRYGDFKTLHDELRKHHPGEDVPFLPSKDRTTSGGNGTQSNSRLKQTKSIPNLHNASTESLPPSSPNSTAPSTPLQRERNRLTLRSYLHSLLVIPEIGSSPVLRSFLSASPTTLSEEEVEDAQRREDLDRIREEGKQQFEREVSERVDKLRTAVKDVKGDLMGPDGLTHVFATVRATPNAADLPPNFRAVMEWGRISLASTIFHHFIASDSGSESLTGLKRIHGLMPYFMLKGILKISNPVAMIRGVMDLFMAQPFGGRSLLQRMFTSSMAEEVKALEEEIEAVVDKVDDPMICDKIRRYIYAPREIQSVYKADAAEEKVNLLAVILRSPDEPVLSRPQMHRVMRAARAHAEYIRQRETAEDSDDDEGPEDEDGWLFEDLGILIRLYARLRDREQMIELVFEGTTADLLRDIITIFYSPLAQVYKAASIADSIGDLQNFINDLIKTVEQGEEMSQEDPSKTVELFIDLVSRHEQAFYSFVHKVHSKGEGLFDSLMRWIDLFLTFVREGLVGEEPISLEFILPHTGPERVEILKEVDAVAMYHYRLKVAYEAKVRRRFKKQGGAAAEEEMATQALVDNVIGELQFGSLIKGDTEDIYAEEDDDESFSDSDESYDSEGSETDSGSEETVSSDHSHTVPKSSSPPDLRTHDSSSSGSSIPSISFPKIHPSSPSRTSLRSPLNPSNTSSALPSPAVPRLSVAKLQSEASIARSSLDKPLPLPPPNAHRRTRSGDSGGTPSLKTASIVRRKARRKGAQVAIEPPDLKVIPKLLPIFVELIRPHLRPRTV